MMRANPKLTKVTAPRLGRTAAASNAPMVMKTAEANRTAIHGKSGFSRWGNLKKANDSSRPVRIPNQAAITRRKRRDLCIGTAAFDDSARSCVVSSSGFNQSSVVPQGMTISHDPGLGPHLGIRDGAVTGRSSGENVASPRSCRRFFTCYSVDYSLIIMEVLQRLFEQRFHAAPDVIQPLQGELGGSGRKIIRLAAGSQSAIGILYGVREE